MKHHEKLRQGGSKALTQRLPAPIAALILGGGGFSVLLVVISALLLLTSAIRPQLVETLRLNTIEILTPALQTAALPLQTASLFVRDVSGLAALQSENMRLKEENLRLRDWYQTALLLEAENKSLRDLMHVKLEPESKFISARILSDSGGAFAKSLLVAAGEKEGLEKGQAVLSSQGVVGRITETGSTASRVLLITDINSRLPVLVEDTSLHAILAGTNGPQGDLIHLPLGSKITEGSRIITSGQGGLFPFGLSVGIVHTGPNGKLKVKPFTDFNRMIHVRIIEKPSDPYLREGALLPFNTLN